MPNLETANELERSYEHPYIYWLDADRPSVRLGEDVTLTTRAGDPNSNSRDSITYAWTKLSGPGTATFGTPATNNSTVSFDQAGTYVVELEVTDTTAKTAAKTVSIYATDGPEVTIGASGTTVTEGAAGVDITATVRKLCSTPMIRRHVGYRLERVLAYC